MTRNPVNELAAAMMLFTRLPLGRVWPAMPTEPFNHAVTWWPLTGWITSGLTVAVIYLIWPLTSMNVAVVAALAVRMMFTGAMHEDGLADMADALGGRVDRQRALAIMKDSQIGSYGVLALIVYCMMFVAATTTMAPCRTMLMIICADPWARFCAGRLTSHLTYARPEGAKNHLSYTLPSIIDCIVSFTGGALPIAVATFISGNMVPALSAIVPAAVTALIIIWLRQRLGGYTGDCCGGTCLLCEISYMLTFCALS